MPNVMPLQAGDPRRVGRYRLTGRLNARAGGDNRQRVFMGKIVDNGAVVVTLLGKERVADAAARDRFTAKARVARRVAPFCAARILDAGIEGEDPYLVAEYVPGPNLTEAVGRDGPLPPGVLEALAIGTATGLMAIHQTDPVLTVSVRLSLPAGSATGTITYSSLSCSGTLAIVSAARDRLTLDQNIRSGQANCPDGVITMVTGPAGTAVFTFLRPGGNNPTGTLTRTS